MNPFKLTAWRCAALLSFAVSVPGFAADWVVSTDPTAVRPTPANLDVQVQNPPSFAWSRLPTATASTTYVLELTRTGATSPITYSGLSRNWYMPSTTLEPGTYSWRVRPTAEPTNWSTPRSFVIPTTATAFVVPENATLRAYTLAHPRSRMLPTTFLPYAKWTPAMIAERGAAYKALVSDVVGHMPMTPVLDANWTLVATTPMTAAYVAQLGDIRNRINNTGHQLEAAALLYRLSNDVTYLNEAIKRGDELAALAPDGVTSYVNQDQATRVICLSLSKAYDYLWNNLDATRRTRWMNVVAYRTAQMYADLAGSNGRMDQYPFDNHGGNNIGFLALIAALNLGDVPAATQWYDFSVRYYVHSVFAWSGAEGGFSNGTAYGQAAMDLSLQIWDPLAEMTGVNLFKKPWAKGFKDFFTMFVPPGAKVHAFGDGSEDTPTPKFLKAFASRFATPEAKWYYDNIAGQEDALTLLLAPSPLPVSRVAAGAPPANSGVYPSIGWVAMHNNQANPIAPAAFNPNRVSLYFKSSPFGSYAHSHGDQNAILLHAGSRVLLTQAGYYEYGTPLFYDWYRQTKSHNAVTYDGGIGQAIDRDNYPVNLLRTGRINSFAPSADLDYAEGDATAAYGGNLTAAIRRVWFSRKLGGAAVIMDTLASPSTLPARSFEWNLHAAASIVYDPTTNVASITNVDRSVCIRPISPGLSYKVTVAPPPKPGTVEGHGAYYLPASRSAEILMLLDVGCAGVTGKVNTVSGARVLTLSNAAKTVTQDIPLP
ncbi:DUF4962 domain-containing protein [Duganella radicis]|uniref:DUF4962 domain-containing protein n=1 Tax=Duganella radicis TaxID=551988 RepID=A0A6L6PS63_9BURK|nr:DUF4962 domain-containing protein [Duganella radicis]MTV41908.1 DUF4962 domain-containing protein [Duganella radicis]